MKTEDRNRLAVERRTQMDRIIIDNSRAQRAREVFDFLIEHGQQAGEGEKRCVGLIAPSQSGKSTLLRAYAAKRNSPDLLRDRKVPVLHFTLQANLTRRQFAEELLVALGAIVGCNASERTGTEVTLHRRVAQFLRLAGVQLLVLDESHHLVHSDNRKVIISVSEAIKHMLITGVCPIVLSGIEDVRKIFNANAQLAHRAEPAISLSPLAHNNEAEMQLFFDFLANYLTEIEDTGIINNATKLLAGDIPACLLQVSQGVLGAACNLLKAAVVLATRAGRDEVIREDLATATAEFHHKGVHQESNPFRGHFVPLREAS